MTAHNESIANDLLTIASRNKAANAYLICGGDSETRYAIARRFAEALVDSPADVLMPQHEKETLFSVEDVRREINETASIRPYGEKKKVYIVRDAALMNVQAQNALLKTLEEPPAFVVIVLLADNASVFLPTIVSRTVRIALSEDEIAETPAEDGELTALLNLCEHMTAAGILNAARRYAKKKNESLPVKPALDAIRKRFRDALVKKSGQSVAGDDASVRAVMRTAELLSFESIEAIIEAVGTAEERIAKNAEPSQVMELILFTIRSKYQEAL